MNVVENPSLSALNTFGLAARAGLLVEIQSEEDVLQLPLPDPARDLILGGGSNIVFVDDVPGTVLLNRIQGIAVIEENDQYALVEAGAGENWHGLVGWSVKAGLSGIENLALIPGLAGAAPIQNIGAYGVELSSVLHSVTAWDLQQGKWAVLSGEDCRFGYRDSLFKSVEPGRYLITSICLELAKRFEPRLAYAGLADALLAAGATEPAPADVFAAVISLRRSKLPDPAVAGNAGSFFKNPVVDRRQLENLLRQFHDVPHWPQDPQTEKIPAGWLIERCQLKGFRLDGAEVSRQHALVLVNAAQATGAAVWKLAQHVQRVVFDRFGISLEPEPVIYRSPATAGAVAAHE